MNFSLDWKGEDAIEDGLVKIGYAYPILTRPSSIASSPFQSKLKFMVASSRRCSCRWRVAFCPERCGIDPSRASAVPSIPGLQGHGDQPWQGRSIGESQTSLSLITAIFVVCTP